MIRSVRASFARARTLVCGAIQASPSIRRPIAATTLRTSSSAAALVSAGKKRWT